MDEAVKAFLLESHENLEQMERELVALEQQPNDRELLASVFRIIHTVKGTCGCLAYSKLEALSHAGENLLVQLRNGELQFSRSIADVLLHLIDAIREMLGSIEETGREGERNDTALIRRLAELSLDAEGPPPAPPETRRKRKKTEPKTEGGGAQTMASDKETPSGQTQLAVKSAPLAEEQTPITNDFPQTLQSAAVAESAVRVDVGLLDRLMDLVGELVLARNRIVQVASNKQEVELNAPVQFIDRITNELQEEVMKTRLQPIDTLFNRFPRLVRDLAATFNKQVDIEMEGGETELDRSIIEAVKDPLLHLIRNAVDHGIENPAHRVGVGKTPRGRILLRAFSEGGQVVIEVRDDGAGIDPRLVKLRAVEQGMVSGDDVAQMGDRDAIQLIFMRGFSTTKEVTNFSGRGVGMDVVRSNVESLGGTVEVNSETGRGTTTKMKIPLTLAIIPALIVRDGDERYAIPQANLLELFRLDGKQTSGGIERFKGVPVYRLRGKLLPVVYLKRELGGAAVDFATRIAARDAATNMIVLQADTRQFGLVVDGIEVFEEIVVKPLGHLLKWVPLYAGATILGDGSIALILDIIGLAQRAHVVSGVTERVAGSKATDRETSSNLQQILLFRGPDSGRMIIPLEKVARLENFPQNAIEFLGDQEVVQYRGSILPLVRVPSTAKGDNDRRRGAAVANSTDRVNVIVYASEGQPVGIIVDEILDILEEEVAKENAGSRQGVLGSAIVRGKVTQLLDVEGLVAAVKPILSPSRKLTGGL